jgi:ribosome biogenesis GTPase A
LCLDYQIVAIVNAAGGNGIKRLLAELHKLPRKKAELPLRLIIAGIPNVGKSSLLNRLTGRRATQTGDKPGITRDAQWVRSSEGLEILDTPGMLWPKINSEQQAFSLAVTGAVKAEIIDMLELGLELVAFLSRQAQPVLQTRFNIADVSLTPLELLEKIGVARGCLLKGGRIDLTAAARMLVQDFREGRLGRITLERPDFSEEGVSCP